MKKNINNYISLQLSDRQLCDLELLLNGGFNPLSGFMNKNDYESVLDDMRLVNGSLWPIPITLDINEKFVEKIKNDKNIALKDKEGFTLAILHISDIWKPNLAIEAEKIYGTTDTNHPGVHYIFNTNNNYYLGGIVEPVNNIHHHDFGSYRHTPKELKVLFKKKGWENIVAFQTRNPMHRAHIEMTMKAAKNLAAKILIHPVVGITKPGDIDYFTRVRCYKHVIGKYPEDTAMLSLLPLAMRMAGPREAIWHALIRKNYGCTHLIVGRDHAGPGVGSNNKSFYGAYDAQQLLINYQDEIGINMVPFKFMVYLPDEKKYADLESLKSSQKHKKISGTELRSLLDKGKPIPKWFTYKEVADELKKMRPPLPKQGLTIFFTGLSGAGKSTLAKGLQTKFMENNNRQITLLDGDIVRTHLSSELGFSKEHRSLNVRRIGFVASEITKNGGIAICAPIAPYESDRQYNRQLISSIGGFVEIYVSTPLEKCEERDAKGLYALAREGKIDKFTGISDPYEEPANPEIIVNSSSESPGEIVNRIIKKLSKLGYV